jgi:hypothetical protein
VAGLLPLGLSRLGHTDAGGSRDLIACCKRCNERAGRLPHGGGPPRGGPPETDPGVHQVPVWAALEEDPGAGVGLGVIMIAAEGAGHGVREGGRRGHCDSWLSMLDAVEPCSNLFRVYWKL